MIARNINLPDKRSFFLFGSRQTGKSTLVKSRFPKAWYVNLLDNQLLFHYMRDPALFRQHAVHKIGQGFPTIIIDEIQRLPDLLNDVQILMFDHPDIQFIMTGSSARKLKRGKANLLGGRAWAKNLFPLTVEECPQLRLEDILHWGTLPPVIVSPSTRVEFLQAYAQVYLEEEIKNEGLIRNLQGFARFLDVVSANSGELVSFSAVSRECAVPIRTVQSYYEILEDTMIGIRLMPWYKSVRKRLVAHPKFYLFDLGVTNALNRRLSGDLDRITLGRLFEQFIVLETFRMVHYMSSEGRIYFWRTNTGAEVDLIIEQHQQPKLAIEIKKTAVVSGADISGLRAFSQEYPQAACLLVADVAHAYKIDHVSIIPWKDYVMNLQQYLGKAI